MDARYKLRKVLARDKYARPVMTMARFVPWGIQPEEGVKVSSLGLYLGIRRDHFSALLKKLGLRTWHEEPSGKRNTRGRSRLVSEEDAAKVIVHVRSREGLRLLKASAASHVEEAAPVPSPAIPPPESTGE